MEDVDDSRGWSAIYSQFDPNDSNTCKRGNHNALYLFDEKHPDVFGNLDFYFFDLASLSTTCRSFYGLQCWIPPFVGIESFKRWGLLCCQLWSGHSFFLWPVSARVRANWHWEFSFFLFALIQLQMAKFMIHSHKHTSTTIELSLMISWNVKE